MPESPEHWMTSAQAAARLSIKRQTLYAYVSRGILRSDSDPITRQSRFKRTEIESLAARGKPRRSTRNPVLDLAIESAVTTVPDGPSNKWGHRYRGHRAVGLADSSTFEAVAAMLICGDDETDPVRLNVSPPALAAVSADPLTRMRTAIDLAGDASANRFQSGAEPRLDAAYLAECASIILGVAVGSIVSAEAPVTSSGNSGEFDRSSLRLRSGATFDGSIAGRIATACMPHGEPSSWVVEATNAVLILMADHEMATSTLAARVAASVRADPFRCIVAALATLSGQLHGTVSDQVRRALRSERPADVLLTASPNAPIAGFGHPLYSGSDPRYLAIRSRIVDAAPKHPAVVAAERLVREMDRRAGLAPNCDLGLALFAEVAAFDENAATSLFALGRIAGWLAHIAEEYSATPLRYRARAVSPVPPLPA